MQVSYNGKEFICRCNFESRTYPKQAGFCWDIERKLWYTQSHGIAARLRVYCDEQAKREIDRLLLTVTPWSGRIPHPTNLEPKPFQLKAALFSLARNRSYLGLDPGLGKTICAALIRNALDVPALYICPPFLAANVEEEFLKWTLSKYDELSIYPDEFRSNCVTWIMPDSRLARAQTLVDIERFKRRFPNAVLFIDEAHRFKDESALRTKALFTEILPGFDRVVFMSGTPMPNRPIELWPVLSKCAPETIDFMNRFKYGLKYCAGYQSHWGWDFSGASNVSDLAGRVINRFMLRIRKPEVLHELPPKSEELVIIGDRMPKELHAMDQKLLKEHSPEDLMKQQIGAEHISTYRKELGKAKVPHAVEYLASLLEETDENLLVFAIHRDVIRELTEGLARHNPLVIDGSVEKEERFERVKTYQNSKDRRLMILNIQAGGIGFNLTKANRVVFTEYSWTPADNEQASDRAHRIGQTGNVLVQYLVFKNSIDKAVMDTIFRKKSITKHI